MKKNRFLAVVITAVIVFVLGFSFSYIAQNEIHKCTGENCPVCIELHECEAVINNIGGAVFGSMAMLCAVGFVVIMASRSYKSIEKSCTLISMKVKLSD